MDHEWRTLEEFPKYYVSNYGEFVNNRTDSDIQPSVNQQGHAKISLYAGGQLRTRSAALLVAGAFLPRENDIFDTPIHLDGDLINCRADNLMWRPRWFAIKYHKQFGNENFINDHASRVDVISGELYSSMRDVCVTNGIHYHDVINSEYNGSLTFPTWQQFRVVY